MKPVAYAVKITDRFETHTRDRIELWSVNAHTKVRGTQMIDRWGQAGEIVAQFGETEDGRLIEMDI